MRKILWLVLVMMCPTTIGAESIDLASIAWVSGDWLQSSSNRTVEEHWSTPSTNALVGMSRTVRDGRTVAFEFLRIERRDNDVFYVAQPGGRPPTDFKLTSAEPGVLVFEGDGRDRVKRITYRRAGPNGLHALVEGDENGRPLRFEFHYQRRGPAAFPRLVDRP